MKNKKSLIVCIIIAVIIIIIGVLLLVFNNGKNESKSNLPEKTSTEVSKDGKTEKIMYDGIEIYGSYKSSVMNIKLVNTTDDNYIITAVTMKTYKDGKESNSHKFEMNQLLKAGDDTTMSFMEELKDFDRIDYEITKEKVKN